MLGPCFSKVWDRDANNWQSIDQEDSLDRSPSLTPVPLCAPDNRLVETIEIFEVPAAACTACSLMRCDAAGGALLHRLRHAYAHTAG